MTPNESSEIVAEELASFLDTYDPDQSALVDVVLLGDPASAPQGDQLAGAPAFEAAQGLLQLVAPWFLALAGQFFSELQEQTGKQAAGGFLTWIGSWFTSRKAKQPDVTKVKRGVDATKLADTLPKLATDLKSAGLSDVQVLQAMGDLVARANAAAEAASKKPRAA